MFRLARMVLTNLSTLDLNLSLCLQSSVMISHSFKVSIVGCYFNVNIVFSCIRIIGKPAALSCSCKSFLRQHFGHFLIYYRKYGYLNDINTLFGLDIVSVIIFKLFWSSLCCLELVLRR